MNTENKMTRCSALKQMGLALEGALAVSSGVMPLTLCKEKKKTV